MSRPFSNPVRRGCFLVLFGSALCVSVASAQPAPILRGMQPLPIPEMLRIVSSDATDTDPAEVKILLNNGHELSGTVSLYSPEKHTCTVTRNGVLSLVNTDDVTAVTLLHAGSAAVALQGGKIYRPNDDPGPTRLTLERSAAELAAKCGVPVAVSVPPEALADADCRFSTAKMLSALGHVLDEVTRDEMGKKSLSRYGSGLALKHASKEATAIQVESGKSISVVFDCTQPLDGRYSDEISAGINRAL